eukprot:comp23763_c0_seq1/m.41151 comp23763_c0_seq1/g.41151  ORF comp23763_c0_seq1/g.41151 comp23763_c0_seq1/m.41151 type:complete len:304 (+) comp23763_c0_seq1:539-1450(+)
MGHGQDAVFEFCGCWALAVHDQATVTLCTPQTQTGTQLPPLGIQRPLSAGQVYALFPRVLGRVSVPVLTVAASILHCCHQAIRDCRHPGWFWPLGCQCLNQSDASTAPLLAGQPQPFLRLLALHKLYGLEVVCQLVGHLHGICLALSLLALSWQLVGPCSQQADLSASPPACATHKIHPPVLSTVVAQCAAAHGAHTALHTPVCVLLGLSPLHEGDQAGGAVEALYLAAHTRVAMQLLALHAQIQAVQGQLAAATTTVQHRHRVPHSACRLYKLLAHSARACLRVQPVFIPLPICVVPLLFVV